MVLADKLEFGRSRTGMYLFLRRCGHETFPRNDARGRARGRSLSSGSNQAQKLHTLSAVNGGLISFSKWYRNSPVYGCTCICQWSCIRPFTNWRHLLEIKSRNRDLIMALHWQMLIGFFQPWCVNEPCTGPFDSRVACGCAPSNTSDASRLRVHQPVPRTNFSNS